MNSQNELLIYWYSSQVNQRCSDIEGSTKLYLCTTSSVCTLYRGVYTWMGRWSVSWDVRACQFGIWYFVFVTRLQTLPKYTLPFFLQWLQQSSHIYITTKNAIYCVIFTWISWMYYQLVCKVNGRARNFDIAPYLVCWLLLILTSVREYSHSYCCYSDLLLR